MPCTAHSGFGFVNDCVECQKTCHFKSCTRNNLGFKYCSKKCRKRSNQKLSSCICTWCNYWKKIGVTEGIAIVLLQKDKVGLNALICKENFKYAQKYNITTGKMEEIDNGCRINTCCRELYEELNIKLSPKRLIDKIKFSWNHEGTAVVVLEICPINIERKNWELQIRNSNEKLPETFKEINKVSHIDIKTMISPECDLELTDYAKDILDQLNKYMTNIA